ncbi:4Fe-4S binding protein [Dehalococcoidia bacterium]|nr:4Fe-4S binding protein [Dehalococcoidia bacterium]MCL0059045.1 4Fe-4S binding protein [Dehalococcoidia bacterium]MCL0092326.1 4Fe-4S binding protein [Dehalococcoidia bacterium]MCL0098431.1 4Fe-4S binding protein [Dehalococcoidia bacterium]MCL0104292.1 4Fe-4S binding protein [Dehalococcoidia bacterium]
MVKTKRKIIKIDEEKCDGCGVCIPSCPEGALQIIDGKARIVKENFCDGLGACLGDCPQGALTIEEKEVEEYDQEGVIAHIRETSPELLERHLTHLKEHAHELPQDHSHQEVCSCPSLQIMAWEHGRGSSDIPKITSELRHWPIQLHLVPPHAPYFQNADLVLVADCVPFAYADFHRDFLKDKAIAICCPKLDDTSTYLDKITQILRDANVKSLKVLHMEVPCCFGLVHTAQQALAQSGKDIPFDSVEIGIKGEISS